MNGARFISRYNEYQRTIPALNHDAAMKVRALIEGMHEDAEPEHKGEVRETSYMSDKAFCSCGWEGTGFWDGVEYADKQWREHVYEEIIGDEGFVGQ